MATAQSICNEITELGKACEITVSVDAGPSEGPSQGPSQIIISISQKNKPTTPFKAGLGSQPVVQSMILNYLASRVMQCQRLITSTTGTTGATANAGAQDQVQAKVQAQLDDYASVHTALGQRLPGFEVMSRSAEPSQVSGAPQGNASLAPAASIAGTRVVNAAPASSAGTHAAARSPGAGKLPPIGRGTQQSNPAIAPEVSIQELQKQIRDQLNEIDTALIQKSTDLQKFRDEGDPNDNANIEAATRQLRTFKTKYDLYQSDTNKSASSTTVQRLQQVLAELSVFQSSIREFQIRHDLQPTSG